MSAVKHTPGPWTGRSETGKFNGDHEWIARHESSAHTSSVAIWGSGKVIALVVDASDTYQQKLPHLAANSNLIAAAPELLEALELAHLLLSGANMNRQVVEEKVCAAIAKATGAAA